MVDVYMFDMGGVLSEENSMAGRLLSYLGFTGDNLRQLGPESAKAIEACLRGDGTEEQFWKTVERERKVTLSEKNLLSKFFNPVMDEKVVAIVKRLRAEGKRVICGTNVIEPHYAVHRNRHDYDLFDAAYFSFAMHLSKPDPAFFLEIAKQEGIPPERFFFTDDMECNVASARSVGMQAYRFVDANKLEKDLEEVM